MGRADSISISLCGAIFNVFVALTIISGLSIIIFIMPIYNKSIVASVLYCRCFYHNLLKTQNPRIFADVRVFSSRGFVQQ